MTHFGHIALTRLTVHRGAEELRRTAVSNVTMTIAAGERVFLLGPNGAGKTSILLAMVGAVAFEGSVVIGETPVEKRTLSEVRRKVAYVFADPSDQFFLTE